MPVSPLLAALAVPLLERQFDWPRDQPVLFMRAQPGWAGTVWAQLGLSIEQLHCQQSFKPLADGLRREACRLLADESLVGMAAMEPAGMEPARGAMGAMGAMIEPAMTDSVEPAAQPAAAYSLILLLPPRSREEARALMALAAQRLRPGGWLLCAQANNEGARSGETDLARLFGHHATISKHKCRAYWARYDEHLLDRQLLTQWRALDQPRPIADGRYLSRPGLFAWDRLDQASQLLVAHLPGDLAGRGADLGAGFGYLAAEVAARCPAVHALDLYEAEARALALAQHNLAAWQGRLKLAFHWHDVAQGLPAGRRYDFIVSNPPFHQGRRDEPQLGQAFITAAAAALERGGRLWLVANQHLPYEQVLGRHFSHWRAVVVQQGFKVIEAVK